MPRGLTRFTVRVLIELARNATDAVDGFLLGTRFLIHDRDPLFTSAVRDTLAAGGVEALRLPARSPNVNAFAERFIRTIKASCLEWRFLIGEGSPRRAIREFVERYHHERNHQGLGNQLILPCLAPGRPHGPISCRQRLGGMLTYYHRPAA